jgi:hypothetical protein
VVVGDVRRGVIDGAAAMFAVYHVLFFGGVAVVAIERPEALGVPPWPSTPAVIALAAWSLAACLPFGISVALFRRSEWGREWFTRCPTIEVGLGAGVAELVWPNTAHRS